MIGIVPTSATSPCPFNKNTKNILLVKSLYVLVIHVNKSPANQCFTGMTANLPPFPCVQQRTS